MLRYQAFAGRFPFALKMDIRKYFPSIDHDILKAQLRRAIEDPPVFTLIERIIDVAPPPERHVQCFPETACSRRSTGLPGC